MAAINNRDGGSASEATEDREVTIHDVARAAGVSKTTVSRVLNGSTGVSADTRARVLETVGKLDYQVNMAARSLRTARTSLVGLLVPAISNDVFGRIAEVLEEDLRADGAGLMIMSSGWASEGETLALDFMRSRRVDGLVASLVDDRSSHVADYLRSLGRPVVLLDREVRGAGADVVLTDERNGINAALEHLASLGHRDVGLAVLSQTVRPGREALSAFDAAAAALGLSKVAQTVVTYDRINGQTGWEIGEQMIRAGATAAVCCVPNSVTAGVLECFSSHGMSVPGDVSVIGFDDGELSSVKPPRLTVITRPLAAIAHHAHRMIITRLANNGLPPRVAMVHMTLHIQESTAPPRSGALKK